MHVYIVTELSTGKQYVGQSSLKYKPSTAPEN